MITKGGTRSGPEQLASQILGELGRVGNNLNQIARSLDKGHQARLQELKDALRAYIAIRDAIFEAVGKNHGPVP